MAEHEIFAESEAISRVADDRELFAEIFKTFAQDLPLQIKRLWTALAEEDLQSARDIAHTIKGAMASLSAKRGCAAASAVEESVKKGDLRMAGELTGELEQELAALIKLVGERGLA
jgi:HPt (histidine-containing phosphotransfer) domain-containing protein